MNTMEKAKVPEALLSCPLKTLRTGEEVQIVNPQAMYNVYNLKLAETSK